MNAKVGRAARTEHLQSARAVFAAPIWLAVATGIGLVSALFGDGAWNAVSWLAILAPVATVGWAWRRRGG